MSSVVHLPEELARRLEAAAASRGVTPDELATEVLEARLPDTGALAAFIGSGDSGDPTWASRDIHELRAELASRRRAEGA
jgi:hypothetical protein